MSSRDTRPELPIDPDAPIRAPRPLHLQWAAIVMVFVGGIVGTGTRYAVARALPTPAGGWPWATFLVNLLGAFVLGALLEALARSGDDKGLRRRLRLLVGTGLCGSLTTYSTFAVEADLLVRDHAASTAIGYLAASLLGGVAATAAGIAAATCGHRYRAGSPRVSGRSR